VVGDCCISKLGLSEFWCLEGDSTSSVIGYSNGKDGGVIWLVIYTSAWYMPNGGYWNLLAPNLASLKHV
jgi:hypothetical protein